MKKQLIGAAVTAAISATAPSLAVATTNISAGVWANYRYVTDSDFNTFAPGFNSDLDEETGGDIGRESLILYGDHSQDDGPWRLSTEVRFGPGSFSDPDNNSTGTYTSIHKLWVGRDIGENWDVRIGKSEVPFGWKTVNFWPGDALQGGYGDQMDVGVKFTGNVSGFDTAFAYYHQDDWGETSTDSIDDNGHWGSSETYRKIQTGVADASYTFGHDGSSSEFGVSAQAGKLQNLSDHANNCENSCTNLDDGSHHAFAAYYQGEYGPFTAKAEVIRVNRDIPQTSADVPKGDVKNTRYALQGGYSVGNWFAYIDATAATTDTDGNDADTVHGIAPGVRYDYGPGWVYVEYLNSNGDIDGNGDIYESDFDAMYVTMDYYF
ncbi:MAG: porin [Pseudomonadota bacterium]